MTAQGQPSVFNDLDISGCKIMSLSEEKRKLIIDAAIKEFTKGYRKANTATIAREANISKGLLFHYFPTKKELYFFLIKYALNVILPEYEKASLDGKDFLESLWEMTMIKMDMIKKHGDLYEFMLSMLFTMQKEFPEEFQNIRNPALELMGRIYQKADNSLIRAGIDPDKAYKLITWMIAGYSDEIIAQMSARKTKDIASLEPEFQRMLDEWEDYLAILRKAFYKS